MLDFDRHILPIISVATGSSYLVYISAFLKNSKRKYESGASRILVSPETVLIISHLISAVLLLPFLNLANFSQIPSSVFVKLLGVVFTLCISRQLYYYAYAHAEVAEVTIFSALTPVYALFIGYLLAGEIPEQRKILGLLIVSFSIYAMFLPSSAQKQNTFKLFFQPFQKILENRAVTFAFLSTIPTAFAAVWQKQLIPVIGATGTAFCLLLLIGLFSSLFSSVTHGANKIFNELKVLPYHFYLISGVLVSVNHVVFCFVMQRESTAIALIIQRSSIMLQIVLAYFLLGEKDFLLRRVSAAVAILIGFAVLVW